MTDLNPSASPVSQGTGNFFENSSATDPTATYSPQGSFTAGTVAY